jgi:predicted enzyme related to lactoylglutathione lyase
MTSFDSLGVPCRIDTFQPEPAAAASFYGDLLGWTFDPPLDLPFGPYRRARRHGRVVAGIGQAPPGLPAAVWSTYVGTSDLAAAVARATAAGARVAVGPLDGADGRFAVLTDPAGVAIALWDGPGTELVAVPGTWALSAPHTPDLEAGAAFYANVFGWRADRVPGAPLWFLRLPGHAGAPGRGVPDDVVAIMTPATPAVPPHWSVSFRVGDVDATAAAAVELGGTIVVAPVDAAGQRTAAIADPQGGVIALVAPEGG